MQNETKKGSSDGRISIRASRPGRGRTARSEIRPGVGPLYENHPPVPPAHPSNRAGGVPKCKSWLLKLVDEARTPAGSRPGCVAPS
eukprot:1410722-Prymnesium_polylepis.1